MLHERIEHDQKLLVSLRFEVAELSEQLRRKDGLIKELSNHIALLEDLLGGAARTFLEQSKQTGCLACRAPNSIQTPQIAIPARPRGGMRGEDMERGETRAEQTAEMKEGEKEVEPAIP
mmetsp:Transcript_14565/g.33461  ORF Transcript_14565/g.33461 Transcript_14565/m.33461 type:complete len:119 (+) Transcript_14565:55-411(+)